MSRRLVYFSAEQILRTVLAGVARLRELQKELAKNEVVLRLVEAHASVHDLLRLEGVEDWCGQITRFQTVAAAIDGYCNQEHS
ncbi:MAG: hypothetical protein JO308_08145 [Verrucomicrobia bacterium]|nr:hypothetical protein [Verrucomicrobiota bacterium]